MTDRSFDAIEFATYVRERWLTVATACGVALALAVTVSFLLPRRYTATATILIQPPRGADPRAATAVSQIYIESLKTYEQFASSDTLFVRALDAVGARDALGNGPIESLKRHALKVSKPATTSLLEIDVTLADPRKAQTLAAYIAQQTVDLSRSLNAKASDDMIAESRSELKAAESRYDEARKAGSDFAASHPVESLESEVQEDSELRYELQRDLDSARAELAGNTLDGQIASTKAKIASLENRTRELDAVLAKNGPELELRKTKRETLDGEQKSALAAYDTANRRMNEILASAQDQGERLEILDPGIVPQQPSSPNTMLNLFAALAISLVGSIVYLAFAFGYARAWSPDGGRAYSLHR